MPRVRVKYLNVYSGMTRKHEEYISMKEGIPLREVLKQIVENNPVKFREYVLDEGGGLRPHVWIFLNKVQVRDLDTMLKDGDTIAFSLPLVGG